MTKQRKPLEGSIIYASYYAGSQLKLGVFFVHLYTKKGLGCYIILSSVDAKTNPKSYHKFDCGKYLVYKRSYTISNRDVIKLLCWIDDSNVVDNIIAKGLMYQAYQKAESKKYDGIWDHPKREIAPLTFRGIVSGGSVSRK